MADKRIQMRMRNAANTEWDNLFPDVKAENVPDSLIEAGQGVRVTRDTEGKFKVESTTASVFEKIVYGVKIAKNNSNPTTAVTYTDDAVGFNSSSGGAGVFVDGGWNARWPYNEIKPCLLSGGRVQTYLNPNNYAQNANGTAVDITSGAAGDVMIEFPKIYYKISQDAENIYVQISNDVSDKLNGFTDWAHSYKGTVQDKFYVGAYLGYNDGGKLRSLSGKTPTASQTIGTFRTQAQANGVGYEILPYNKLTLLQILYLIRFKSLNSQTALGQDYTSGSAAQATGSTNTRGMNYGTTSATAAAKCNGIENFWGNLLCWVDGLITNEGTILIADGDFNDTGAGYIAKGQQAVNATGYIKEVKATNDLGFLIHVGAGSATTYFSDYGSLNGSGTRVPYYGGYFGYGSVTGAFSLSVYQAASYSDSSCGSRLAFCG